MSVRLIYPGWGIFNEGLVGLQIQECLDLRSCLLYLMALVQKVLSPFPFYIRQRVHLVPPSNEPGSPV